MDDFFFRFLIAGVTEKIKCAAAESVIPSRLAHLIIQTPLHLQGLGLFAAHVSADDTDSPSMTTS